LNPAGKPVVTLESDPDGNFPINNLLGAATIRLTDWVNIRIESGAVMQ
jgi:hypothetical protein